MCTTVVVLLSSDLTWESNRRQEADSKKQALCARGLGKPPKRLIRSKSVHPLAGLVNRHGVRTPISPLRY